jgi:hypothetical protein
MKPAHLTRHPFQFGSFQLAMGALLLSACASAGGRERDELANASPSVPSYPNPTMSDPLNPVPTGNPAEQGPDEETPIDPGSIETLLGTATMGGSGQSSDRWHKADVTRDGQNYYLMANGWGPGFGSQSIAWSGTSFTVQSMTGEQGENYQPASYPTVFCGVYSDSQSRACGLPAALDTLTSLRTGWRWNPNGNDGQYNAAYDIWMSNGPSRNNFSGFLMVWYREPVGQQPAGTLTQRAVTVANVEGTWDIWTGQVNNRPIINWVRAEGQDTLSMEFDILDFVRDAQARGLNVPGTHVLSVAVGFEIWNGPVQNLESTDFYVTPEL